MLQELKDIFLPLHSKNRSIPGSFLGTEPTGKRVASKLLVLLRRLHLPTARLGIWCPDTAFTTRLVTKRTCSPAGARSADLGILALGNDLKCLLRSACCESERDKQDRR